MLFYLDKGAVAGAPHACAEGRTASSIARRRSLRFLTLSISDLQCPPLPDIGGARILLGRKARAISSAGRALARQARGHWFKSSIAHHFARAVARPRSQGPSRCVRDRPLIWNRRKRTDDVGTEAVRRSGFPGRPL